jgi:type IV secretory pathway TrbF-like protein
MNEWLNGNEDASPFKRAAKEMVSIEITSVLRSRQKPGKSIGQEPPATAKGSSKGQPVRMRALVTVYVAEPTPQTTTNNCATTRWGSTFVSSPGRAFFD